MVEWHNQPYITVHFQPERIVIEAEVTALGKDIKGVQQFVHQAFGSGIGSNRSMFLLCSTTQPISGRQTGCMEHSAHRRS